MARGESFLVVNVPLLAGLHFDRALELDPSCAAAARHKENLRRLLSDDSASAPPHAVTAAAGGADCDQRHPSEHSSRPPTASEGSILPSSADIVRGGCGDDPEKRVDDVAGDGSPAPAEDGAVFHTDNGNRTRAAAGVTAIGPSSRGAGGGGETGTDRGSDGTAGGGSATAFGRAVAAACENYRAGVVLHQEAFLSSSAEKFLRVLELLEVATAEMKAALVLQDSGGEPRDGTGEDREDTSCKDGGGDTEFDQSGAGGLGGGGAGMKTSSPSRRESLGGGKEVMRSMRVGCHLNIAAAFLSRKTDFESAVDHCTRYAT